MMTTAFRVVVRRTAAKMTPVTLSARWNGVMRMSTSPDNMPPYDGHLEPEQMQVLRHMNDKIDILEAKVADLKTSTASETPKYDGHLAPEQMQSLDHMFDKISSIESHVAELKQAMAEAQRTYAVDSPDGDSDGHVKEELKEIEHIIEDAAALEDKDAIEKTHELEEDVKKFHARDPEHDW